MWWYPLLTAIPFLVIVIRDHIDRRNVKHLAQSALDILEKDGVCAGPIEYYSNTGNTYFSF